MLQDETTSSAYSLDARQALKVGIQGYSGAFHEIAARHCFPERPLSIIPAATFDELVANVEGEEEADLGLMAIENTLAGSLLYNYRLLNESSLCITAEVYLRIKHNLMALPGQRIEDLTEVWSHPMAIAQCREYFRDYPHLRLLETEDTAGSARRIRESGIKTVGAIASNLAADLYGLEILAGGIETNKLNYTRFLVLEKSAPLLEADRVDKVSVCFSVDHEVGSLYKVLAVLAAYQINLTKIQSTPIIGRPWEYFFFLDFVSEGKIGYEQAIEAIRPLTHNLKVLGAYRQGKRFE